MILCVVLAGSAAWAALEVGRPAPSFSLRTLSGRSVSLRSLRGSVVLLDFWASWCVPCRQEFPVLQRLSDRYRDRGLKVIGVTVDEEASNARAFVRRAGTSFTILHDAEHSVAERYAPAKMPTSFLIDRRGIIRHINEGFEPADADKFDRQIRAALGL